MLTFNHNFLLNHNLVDYSKKKIFVFKDQEFWLFDNKLQVYQVGFYYNMKIVFVCFFFIQKNKQKGTVFFRLCHLDLCLSLLDFKRLILTIFKKVWIWYNEFVVDK